jgi:2-oxoisovalerate dehydrogenase E1 component
MSVSAIRSATLHPPFVWPVAAAAQAAESGLASARRFIADPLNREVVATALRIRAVENGLYDLFGKGRLHGTIHTCIGQEFSGALLGRYLKPGDFVTSNHRCHGHFIGATGNWHGLVDELIGNGEGVCAGIGSSQHLWAPNFMSNGQQGGLLPVAAGIALDRKTAGGHAAVVSFLGEGTLGEGIVYETMNLDALWGLPHVMVLENNYYSQSTGQAQSVAGSIADRAKAFGLDVHLADSWDLEGCDAVFGRALEQARGQARPSLILLSTYRLNPHSKGDDLRDRTEIDWFRAHDPATLAALDFPEFAEMYKMFVAEAEAYMGLALAKPALHAASYFPDQLPRAPAEAEPVWSALSAEPAAEQRLAQQLNAFYHAWLTGDGAAFFLGEDIADPYGGAFKVSKGLTSAFEGRARTTPISEAAITGVGIGLAVAGRRAFVEIMFGDFITYAFDQIINNASKIFHMYHRQMNCPVVIRTPMGGRRGYGPTHSQSLERFLIGIDNVCTLSLNAIATVHAQLECLEQLHCPVVLLENKSDYANRGFVAPAGFVTERDGASPPSLRVRPADALADVTLLAYGGMARFVADGLVEIFERSDAVPELIVPVCLSPLNLAPLVESVRKTGALVVIEEGAGYGSVGAEALAQLSELGLTFIAARVSGRPVPIPSAPPLEAAALPSLADICAAVAGLLGRRA